MGREVMTLVVNRLPNYRDFYYARFGSFSLSTNSIRYVAQEDAIDYENKIDTVGGHYRTFLDNLATRYPTRKAPEQRINYPYFARAARLPMAVYVDLRSAYLQIARVVGYEVWFREGCHFAPGLSTPSAKLFEDYKVARGLLVSAHYPKARYTEWKNGNLTDVRFFNTHNAPFFQYAIYSILHAIMSKVKPFSYYVHTDGAIINHRMLNRVEKILYQYGFSYSIKHVGAAHIKTTGAYRIGDYTSGLYDLARARSSDNIRDEYADWWLEQFTSTIGIRPALNSLQ